MGGRRVSRHAALLPAHTGECGKPLLRKQLKRDQVAVFFANLPPCLIGMEACSIAHYWARKP